MYEKAVYWLEKSAYQGDPEAQVNLGVCYYNGQGTEKNIEKAISWLEKAANQGSSLAITTLGHFYRTGENGVKKDIDKAIEYFLVATEIGNKNSRQYLIECIREKFGFEDKNTMDFLRSMNAAYDNNEELMTRLHKVLNMDEKMNEIDYENTKKQAESGNPIFQYLMATKILDDGDGTIDEKKLEEAISWLEKSAKQELPEAEFLLGVIYGDVSLGHYDYDASMKYLTSALQKGVKEAENAIALLRENNLKF